MKTIKVLFAFIALLLAGTVQAQSGKTTPAIQHFMNDRFGMFIHWGPITLRGAEIGWTRGKEVPKEDYDNLYKEFNPVLFNADAWAKAAKDAGMKYLTITSRHHDGFCLWPTKFTSYNIANTPYKKDVLKALQIACKKQGIKFCIYYSVLDWYHPDYPIHSAHDSNPDPKANMIRYISFMKNQLKELLINYDPYMLWFDGQWESPWTDEMGKEIYAYVKSIKPDVITNNRLGKEFAAMENKDVDAGKMVGDYDTPERVVGRLNMNTPWESCFTLCQQWSWKPNDKMESLKKCLSILSMSAGSNGNLLLNVGPMPDGRIEVRQIERLKEIGDWLKVNGDAIYETKGGPYKPNDKYVTTRKGNKIFVHVLDTDTTTLVLPAISGVEVTRSYLPGGSPVIIRKEGDKLVLPLPDDRKGKLQYVVVLETNANTEKLPIVQ